MRERATMDSISTRDERSREADSLEPPMPIAIPIFTRRARSIPVALTSCLLAMLLVTGCGGDGGGGTSTTYTIGGTVAGLSGKVVLQNNGVNNLALSTDGTFTFPGTYPNGTAYDVTILTQPMGEHCAVTSATGMVSSAPVTATTVTCQNRGLALFAGNPFGAGAADGTGAAASFSEPTSVATDSTGNVYVADFNNDTIRKVSPSGVVTTLAGMPGAMGSADGAGAAARFDGPAGVAVDGAGNVYVADLGNNTIREIKIGR